jgi:hypothetical protein
MHASSLHGRFDLKNLTEYVHMLGVLDVAEVVLDIGRLAGIGRLVDIGRPQGIGRLQGPGGLVDAGRPVGIAGLVGTGARAPSECRRGIEALEVAEGPDDVEASPHVDTALEGRMPFARNRPSCEDRLATVDNGLLYCSWSSSFAGT